MVSWSSRRNCYSNKDFLGLMYGTDMTKQLTSQNFNVFFFPEMPTWVSVRNNRNAWTTVNVAVLQQSFSRYGNILQVEVFADGARAQLLFENDGHADTFVEEMTFSTQGPLFIPGIPYGQRLGAWIPNRRERVSRNRSIMSILVRILIYFCLLGWWRRWS